MVIGSGWIGTKKASHRYPSSPTFRSDCLWIKYSFHIWLQNDAANINSADLHCHHGQPRICPLLASKTSSLLSRLYNEHRCSAALWWNWQAVYRPSSPHMNSGVTVCVSNSCWSVTPTQQCATVKISTCAADAFSLFHFNDIIYYFSMHYAVSVVMAAWLDTYFFGPRIVVLLYFTIGSCFDLIHKKHITLICTPMGWNWCERNILTKENICIKWKADEKICNYVPDWVKYFSASTCQLPLEPVPNGRLPGLGEAPENVTSERCRLPLHLRSLRSTASASPLFPLSSLLRSTLLCVPDNGAQPLSAKGSVAARE